MRQLIWMWSTGAEELNCRAGIIPPGFGCQQQPQQGRAAPRDRRSSKAPTANVTSAHGEQDPGWGCERSAELQAPNVRIQNKEEFRCCLQKKASLPAAACTGLEKLVQLTYSHWSPAFGAICEHPSLQSSF